MNRTHPNGLARLLADGCLAVGLLLLAPAPPGWAQPPARTVLEGVRASVVAPAGWERSAQTPAAGQWRVVFRPPDARSAGGKKVAAQCEARVFPVQETEGAASVLMQAADEISRQVGGEGFGLPGLKPLTLLGRPGAEAELVVQSGALRLEGRVRLVRAEAQLWALAWGLASTQAPEDLREVARGFAGTLEPDEPMFFDPLAGMPDPEEALVLPRGEEPIRRRQLEATVEALEAASSLRLPRAARAEAVAALAEDARRGEAATRAGYRDVARALHEASAKPAVEREALATAIGRKVLEALDARSKQGYEPALKVVLLLALGAKPGAGDGSDGLSRLDLEHLVDVAGFVASLGADRAAEDDPSLRAPLRTALAEGWALCTAEERAARREVARRAPALRATWARATHAQQLSFRAGAARLLRGQPVGEPAPEGGTPTPPDPKALRRLLDESPVAGDGLLGKPLAVPAAELLRLLDLLPFASPGK